MKNELVNAAVTGFKESLGLFLAIFAAVAVTIINFINHAQPVDKTHRNSHNAES